MQIQKFGIEIRKIGESKHLYQEIDMVLSKNNIPSGSVSGSVQASALAHSLHKMLKSDQTFYVSTVTDCAKMVGIVIPSERIEVYRSIHCMKWSEMLSDFREMIVAMIFDDFRSILNPDSNIISI